jgi:hypothetical protein
MHFLPHDDRTPVGLSKKPLRKNESLKERVAGDLAVIKGNRQLVRSFFGAESVAYTTN